MLEKTAIAKRVQTQSISALSNNLNSCLYYDFFAMWKGKEVLYTVLHDKSHALWSFMLETLLTSKKSSFVGHALIILLWDLVWLNYRKLLILHFEQPAPPGSSSSFFCFLNLLPPTPAFLHMKKTTITLLQRLSHAHFSSILKVKKHSVCMLLHFPFHCSPCRLSCLVNYKFCSFVLNLWHPYPL